MKVKYIEANEIVKPGKYADCFVGIELERTKEKVSMLCVKHGDMDDIDIEELDPKAYQFKTIEKERVHHCFSVATKKQNIDVINAEVSLMRARRNIKFCESKLKQYFGGSVKVPQLEAEQ